MDNYFLPPSYQVWVYKRGERKGDKVIHSRWERGENRPAEPCIIPLQSRDSELFSRAAAKDIRRKLISYTNGNCLCQKRGDSPNIIASFVSDPIDSTSNSQVGR